MSKEIPPHSVVVVWKKSDRASKKHMTVFTTAHVDQVNTNKGRNPVIPNDYPFIELGVGGSFVEEWKHKHKIKTVNYWPVRK